jgi:hypothetical protein
MKNSTLNSSFAVPFDTVPPSDAGGGMWSSSLARNALCSGS